MDASLGLGLAVLVGSVLLYFLPGLIADHRGRDNAGTIAVLNLLLGWTVLGWLVLLIVAFTGRSGRERAQQEEHLAVMRALLAKQEASQGVPQEPAAETSFTPVPVAAKGQASTWDERANALFSSIGERLGISNAQAIVGTLLLVVVVIGAVLAQAGVI